MRAHEPPDREAPARQDQPARPGTGPAPPTGSVAAMLALQRRAGNAAVAQAVQRSAVHDVLRSTGTPLAGPVRRDMEARLGADFSDVRLHTGALAQRSAAEVGARAYTSGRHVVIGQGGADRHTLAHELTHVIQQRSGPVAGSDNGHGLRVSDPSDAFERAAEANAKRALTAPRPETGTQAGRAVQRAPSSVEASVPVQRWAWVTGVRVKPEDLTDPTMQAMASDELVREYNDEGEFRRHATGQTDHIGNLRSGISAGTWIRFNENGTNVLGETHTEIPLQQMMEAVGGKSFKYEAFSIDEPPEESMMKAAYDDDTQELFNSFGVEGEKRDFAADSLFAKTGEAMALLLGILKEDKIDDLKDGRYFGKPAQRYLKIAWAHGKDVERGGSTNKANARLAKAVGDTDGTLNRFIAGLLHTDHLGDVLDKEASEPPKDVLVDALKKFCQAFIDAALDHPRSELSMQDRTKLAAYELKPSRKPEETFLRWRNVHFASVVKDAVRSGARYVGMGQEHLTYLVDKKLLAGGHPYEMGTTNGVRGRDIKRFEDWTTMRTNEATRPARRTIRSPDSVSSSADS